MRVAALELPASFGEVASALARVDALLAPIAGQVDLALLPELALTGYVSPSFDFDLSRFAEPVDGPTARALAALARKHRLALCGPLVERHGQRLHNTLLGFERDGTLALCYRKRHPWHPELWAAPGNLPVGPVSLAGALVAAAVCYDVHFLLEGGDRLPDARPDDAEARASLARADLLLFPSAWVDEGEDARDSLLPAVARAHAVHVLNANWGRGSPPLPGQGGSRIIEASGEVVARAKLPSMQPSPGGSGGVGHVTGAALILAELPVGK
ncbi:MAG: carbon-nitrogen hydrolase family protein [Myxococcales bacterium]|nr:carbon-nitrogen hydrolase family protein [Myxococcales bacterium]